MDNIERQRADQFGALVGWGHENLGDRLMIKLQFMASATALFQARLAHAAYASAPLPSWPDSPAAELLGPAPAPRQRPESA